MTMYLNHATRTKSKIILAMTFFHKKAITQNVEAFLRYYLSNFTKHFHISRGTSQGVLIWIINTKCLINNLSGQQNSHLMQYFLWQSWFIYWRFCCCCYRFIFKWKRIDVKFWLKGALIQIWKSANTFVFIWK